MMAMSRADIKRTLPSSLNAASILQKLKFPEQGFTYCVDAPLLFGNCAVPFSPKILRDFEFPIGSSFCTVVNSIMDGRARAYWYDTVIQSMLDGVGFYDREFVIDGGDPDMLLSKHIPITERYRVVEEHTVVDPFTLRGMSNEVLDKAFIHSFTSDDVTDLVNGWHDKTMLLTRTKEGELCVWKADVEQAACLGISAWVAPRWTSDDYGYFIFIHSR